MKFKFLLNVFLPISAVLMTGCISESEIISDFCPDDPDKSEPGICGCGIPDTDGDGDTVPDCADNCPDDPNKSEPGMCGCGIPDDDSDGDKIPDCLDNCPDDPNKSEPGMCGCGNSDTDDDGNPLKACIDACPGDPDKMSPGICGCGVPDTDSDGDTIPDCFDNCPDDPNKSEPGMCGCGNSDTDDDGNPLKACIDACPGDPDKMSPGICGCGIPDTDSDGDAIPDCKDACPGDYDKIAPGMCGCGKPDSPENIADSDGDGIINCLDPAPNDPLNKVIAEDIDEDGVPNELDDCPYNPSIQTLAEGQDCNTVKEMIDGIETDIYEIYHAAELTSYRDANKEVKPVKGAPCIHELEYSCIEPGVSGRILLCSPNSLTYEEFDCGMCSNDSKGNPKCTPKPKTPGANPGESCDPQKWNVGCADARHQKVCEELEPGVSFVVIDPCRSHQTCEDISCKSTGSSPSYVPTGGAPGDRCRQQYENDPYINSCRDENTALVCGQNSIVEEYPCESCSTSGGSIICIPPKPKTTYKKYVRLMNDIDLSDAAAPTIDSQNQKVLRWTPINLDSTKFDGNGKTISAGGMIVDEPLFDHINRSEILDLTIEYDARASSVFARFVNKSVINNINCSGNAVLIGKNEIPASVLALSLYESELQNIKLNAGITVIGEDIVGFAEFMLNSVISSASFEFPYILGNIYSLTPYLYNSHIFDLNINIGGFEITNSLFTIFAESYFSSIQKASVNFENPIYANDFYIIYDTNGVFKDLNIKIPALSTTQTSNLIGDISKFGKIIDSNFTIDTVTANQDTYIIYSLDGIIDNLDINIKKAENTLQSDFFMIHDISGILMNSTFDIKSIVADRGSVSFISHIFDGKFIKNTWILPEMRAMHEIVGMSMSDDASIEKCTFDIGKIYSGGNITGLSESSTGMTITDSTFDFENIHSESQSAAIIREASNLDISDSTMRVKYLRGGTDGTVIKDLNSLKLRNFSLYSNIYGAEGTAAFVRSLTNASTKLTMDHVALSGRAHELIGGDGSSSIDWAYISSGHIAAGVDLPPENLQLSDVYWLKRQDTHKPFAAETVPAGVTGYTPAETSDIAATLGADWSKITVEEDGKQIEIPWFNGISP